jgi:hypothetical protein
MKNVAVTYVNSFEATFTYQYCNVNNMARCCTDKPSGINTDIAPIATLLKAGSILNGWLIPIFDTELLRRITYSSLNKRR